MSRTSLLLFRWTRTLQQKGDTSFLTLCNMMIQAIPRPQNSVTFSIDTKMLFRKGSGGCTVSVGIDVWSCSWVDSCTSTIGLLAGRRIPSTSYLSHQPSIRWSKCQQNHLELHQLIYCLHLVSACLCQLEKWALICIWRCVQDIHQSVACCVVLYANA